MTRGPRSVPQSPERPATCSCGAGMEIAQPPRHLVGHNGAHGSIQLVTMGPWVHSPPWACLQMPQAGSHSVGGIQKLLVLILGTACSCWRVRMAGYWLLQRPLGIPQQCRIYPRALKCKRVYRHRNVWDIMRGQRCHWQAYFFLQEIHIRAHTRQWIARIITYTYKCSAVTVIHLWQTAMKNIEEITSIVSQKKIRLHL